MDTTNFSTICKLIYGDDLDFEVTTSSEDPHALQMKVNPDQISLVIGKQGRNIKALRELLFLYNKLHESNYSLTVDEKVNSDADVEVKAAE